MVSQEVRPGSVKSSASDRLTYRLSLCGYDSSDIDEPSLTLINSIGTGLVMSRVGQYLIDDGVSYRNFGALPLYISDERRYECMNNCPRDIRIIYI